MADILLDLNINTGSSAQDLAQINKVLKETRKEIAKNGDETGELTKQTLELADKKRLLTQDLKNEIKFNKSLQGSNDQLRASLSVLTKRYNGLSETQRENTAEGIKLGSQIGALTTKLKENEKAVGDTRRNVGNYKEDIIEAAKETNNFGDAIEGTPFGNFIKGIRATATAFLANPIGAFVAAIAALGAAFSKSEKASRLLSKGSAVLSAVFGELVEFSVTLVDSVVSAFTDPQEAIKSLGQLLIDQVINRFKAIAVFGEGIAKILKGKFTEGFETLTDATLQFATGVEDVTDKVSEFADEITTAVDTALKIEEAESALRSYARAIALTVKELQKEEQLQRSIADDSTKSFKAREEAAELARIASEARAAEELKLAQAQLNIETQRVAQAREQGLAVQDLLDQQLAAQQALADAEIELTNVTRENEQQRSELKQDRLERDLDILIDGFDNQKTINDRLIDNDKETLEARRALFAETVALGDASFNKQIETLQQFTDTQINANDLLNESDAVRLNEKIRSLELSEIIEGRLLEVIRDRRTAESDFAIQQQELGLSQLETEQQVAAARVDIEDSRISNAKSTLSVLKGLAKDGSDAQKAAAIAERGVAIGEIIVNLQREIASIAATNAVLGPVGIPLTASQTIAAKVRAAIGVAQVAATKFAQGGVLSGPSHAQGGIPFSVGGQAGFEAEGGEAIINKRSTSMFAPLLSAINSHKGFGRKFQDGGVISAPIQSPQFSASSATSIFNGDDIAIKIGNEVAKNTQVVLPVETLNEVQNNAEIIENTVTF